MDLSLLGWEPLKLVLIGAAGTLLAGLVARIALTWSAKPKISWHASKHFSSRTDSNGNAENFCFHEILVKNSGRGQAREITISFSESPKDFQFRREREGWFLWNDTVISEDTSVRREDNGGKTNLIIPSLVRGDIEIITLGTKYAHEGDVKSVLCDGHVANEFRLSIKFVRPRDVYIRVFWSVWPIWSWFIPLLIVLITGLPK